MAGIPLIQLILPAELLYEIKNLLLLYSMVQ